VDRRAAAEVKIQNRSQKQMKRLCLVVTLLGVSLGLCGCKAGGTARLQNPNLAIDDIRGDRLGMSLKEYERKHPGSCTHTESGSICTGYETYAGLSSLKYAGFTKQGKLYTISYSVDSIFASELLRAIKEKYGDPGCFAVEGKSCLWSNGHADIRYSNFGKGAVVYFTDEQLNAQNSSEYDAERAVQRKKDQ
jgi:hypothetical protein